MRRLRTTAAHRLRRTRPRATTTRPPRLPDARHPQIAGERLSPQELSLAALVDRARQLVPDGRRALVGLAGPPGAGKSTVADQIVAALGPETAVLVALDGFHLDDRVLRALGRLDRKGAPDTFDGAGYVHLLRRLRARDEEVVYAPVFSCDQERAIAGGLAVPQAVSLVVTEGNYLLCDGPFAPVRALLDATWFLDVDPALRRRRLVARHVAHGRSPDAAEQWVARSDDQNALLVDSTSARADRVVRVVG